jgi:hypothetical protein
MDLSEFISISGQGGLFKVIARTKNGLVVESLADKKRQPVHASQKISALQDISIFTDNEEVPLTDVLRKIFDKEKGAVAIDSKSDPAQLKKYFETILPEYDRDRVYVSDMKKVIGWYNLLQKDNILEEKLKPLEEEKAEAKETKATKAKSSKKASTEENEEEKTPKAKVAKAKTSAAKPKALGKAKDSMPKATSKSKGAKTQTTRKTGA